MAYDTPSRDPRYVAARRVNKRAIAAIAGAREHLFQTGDDGRGELTYEAFAAQQLLDQAVKRVHAALDAVDKLCGVAVYQPYGGRGRFTRRY